MKQNQILLMRLILIISFLLVISLTVLAQPQKTDVFDTISFKQEISGYFTKLKLPGLSIAVVYNGKIIYRQTEGFADLNKKTAILPNSIFPVASITKTFTAVLMMKYAEEGKISLDDYLLKYPFNRIGWSLTSINPNVKLKHFLSQTSEGEPGTDFVYNGGRYNYVYGVFEKISGQLNVPKAYPEELQKNIIGPLHMKSTLQGFPTTKDDSIISRIVTPYRYNKEKGFTVDSGFYKNHDAYPASGLLTDIDDLVSYSNCLDNNTIISADSYNKMTTAYLNNKGLVMPYGLGWFSETIGGVQFHWGYGFDDPFSALLVRVPDKSMTFIMLCNSGSPSGAFRLGYGHLLHSPFAISFVKYFALADQVTKANIDFDADENSIKSNLVRLHSGKMDFIYYDELIAEALMNRYTEMKFGESGNKAKELLLLLYKVNPSRFSKYDPTLIYLLSDLHDNDLQVPMQKAVEAYKRSEYFHPDVVNDIIQFYQKTNQEMKALEFYHMLADSKGFEGKGTVIEACAYLGRYYLKTNNVEGRKYLWRSVIYAKQAGYDSKYIDDRILEMAQQ